MTRLLKEPYVTVSRHTAPSPDVVFGLLMFDPSVYRIRRPSNHQGLGGGCVRRLVPRRCCSCPAAPPLKLDYGSEGREQRK
jgi:hypothetical protein